MAQTPHVDQWERWRGRLCAALVSPPDGVAGAALHAERAHEGLVGGALDVVAIEVNDVAVAVGVAAGVVVAAGVGGTTAALVRDLHAVVVAVAAVRVGVRAAVGALVGDDLVVAAIDTVPVQVDALAVAIRAAAGGVGGSAGVCLAVEVNVAAPVSVFVVAAVAVALQFESSEAHGAEGLVVATGESVPVKVDEVATTITVHAGVMVRAAVVASAGTGGAFADEGLGGGAGVPVLAEAAIVGSRVLATGTVLAGGSSSGFKVARLLAGRTVAVKVAAANAIGVVRASRASNAGSGSTGGSTIEVFTSGAGAVGNTGLEDGSPTVGVGVSGTGGAGAGGNSGTTSVVFASAAGAVGRAGFVADGRLVVGSRASDARVSHVAVLFFKTLVAGTCNAGYGGAWCGGAVCA